MSKICLFCGHPFEGRPGNYCGSECMFKDEIGEPKPERKAVKVETAAQYMYVRMRRNGEHWPNIIREKGSNRLVRVCFGHLIPRI